MTDEQRLPLALLALRPGVFLVMLMWTVDKFLRAEHAAKMGLVRYQVSKTNGGPSYHEWPAAEIVGRVAALVPTAP